MRGTRPLILGVLIVAGLAPAEGRADLRRSLKRAQRAIEDAQDDVDDAGRKCRRGLSTNLKSARKQIRALKRGPTGRRLKDAHTLVAGLVVAARSARCPDGVIDDLKEAKRWLSKAKRSYRADDDDDVDDGGGGGKIRRSLKRALRHIGDVEDELDHASAKCRKGLRGNVRSARRQVRGLMRRATQRKLDSTNGFMAGLYMACKLAKCTKGVCQDLHQAHRAVYAAKQRFGGGGGGGRGGGHRRYLRKAREAVEDGIDALDGVHKKCRDALSYNMRHSKQTIRGLESSATAKAISDHGLFVAGMVLASGLAKCPASVMNPLQRANRMMGRAKSTYR